MRRENIQVQESGPINTCSRTLYCLPLIGVRARVSFKSWCPIVSRSHFPSPHNSTQKFTLYFTKNLFLLCFNLLILLCFNPNSIQPVCNSKEFYVFGNISQMDSQTDWWQFEKCYALGYLFYFCNCKIKVYRTSIQWFRSKENKFENVSEKVLCYFIRPRTQNSFDWTRASMSLAF